MYAATGDHEVNEIKIVNTCGVLEDSLEMASEEQLAAAGTIGGYMGPVGMDLKKATVVVDSTVMNIVNVEPKRDFNVTYVADIRMIQEGDPCPHCGAPVVKARGIEVGQVFKLYTKYSDALHAGTPDGNGLLRYRRKPHHGRSY